MILIYRGEEIIGSVIKTIIGKRPWYAYAADGPGENFKTRKEAEDWLTQRASSPRSLKEPRTAAGSLD